MVNKVHCNSLKPGYELHWYTIKEIPGQGGFGITYLSHNKNLKQDVTIKEYLPIELAISKLVMVVKSCTNADHPWSAFWGLSSTSGD